MGAFRASARPKLDAPSGYSSPARAALAIAIETRNTLRSGVARLWDAEQSSGDRLDPLDEAIAHANTALGAAKANAAAALADSLATGDGAAPRPDAIQHARAALQGAHDALQAAQDAEGQLRPRREKMQADADAADKHVRDAAVAVLREHSTVSTILADHLRARREYLETLGVLDWLNATNVLGNLNGWGASTGTAQAKETQSALICRECRPSGWAIDCTGSSIIYGGAVMQAATAAWQAAFDALLTDANALLPEMK